jgi:salicylate hydroxylase
MGAGQHVVTYRIGSSAAINMVAVTKAETEVPAEWADVHDAKALVRAFRGWHPAVEALTAEATKSVNVWGLYDIPAMTTWHRGRVALIGDACHAMLPFVAQGACQGLEDAWILAQALKSAEAGKAFTAYQRIRMPRVKKVQRAAAMSGRFYHAAPPFQQAAQMGLKLIDPVVPALASDRNDWIYSYDPTKVEIGLT